MAVLAAESAGGSGGSTNLCDRPLVSVIMIFLNAEKFIHEAIDSVFAQTYEHWELLLVDDGSTDASTAIARRCAERYPGRVRYLEHEGHRNRGMSASRNLGIRNAAGAYVGFLDADDVWLRHNLETQVKALCQQPEAGMVFGRTRYWYGWTGLPEDASLDTVSILQVTPDTLYPPPVLLRMYLDRKIRTPATCSALLRSDAIRRVGGFEEAFRGLYEDQVFFAKIFAVEPVYVVDECLSQYRQHPDSTCAGAIRRGELQFDRPHRAAGLLWSFIEDYLSSQGAMDRETQRALDKRLWPYRHRTLDRLFQSSLGVAYGIRGGLDSVWRAAARLRRLVLRRSSGVLVADPNPILVQGLGRCGTTRLTWTSARTTNVEIHVGAPNGPLMSRTGPTGSSPTGRWVTDGMMFYLQDVSGGLPLTPANTLATVRVRVVVSPKTDTAGDAEHGMLGSLGRKRVHIGGVEVDSRCGP